jgi:sarcosine dehydrogenase
MGYVSHTEPVTTEFVNSGSYEIEIATVRVPAWASLQPVYDAKSDIT